MISALYIVIIYFFLSIDYYCFLFFFFFQAEDGIRDRTVTGVHVCSSDLRRAGGLDADQTHAGVVQEPRKEADRVRAAADARDGDLGQTALGGEDLLPRLAADHGLQLGHDLGVRGRTDA